MKTCLVRILLIFISICVSSCNISLERSRAPQLCQNHKYHSTDESVRNDDLSNCINIAEQNVKTPTSYWILSKNIFFNALAGAAPGAVSGSILGDTAENTAVGAAAGAIVGVILGIQKIYEDQPYYQRFVENCLHKKDYEIIGWK